MGAAQRLYEFNKAFSNVTVTILEQHGWPGGLASSERDAQGFLWDMGGHVVFSHYEYFDSTLDKAVPHWNWRQRAAYAFMKGSDGKRRFIPYPVQNNIEALDKVDQEKCLSGLEGVVRHPAETKPANFDQWLLQNFGIGLYEVFMRKYNHKVWTVPPIEMNSVWVGERVAVPVITKIKTKIVAFDNGTPVQDSEWGPNRNFRFPRYNGTGGIWKAVYSHLPQHWFKFNHKVVKVDIDSRKLTVEKKHGGLKSSLMLEYNTLISTVPLDLFSRMIKGKDASLEQMKHLSSQLVFTHTHIVGIGLSGQPPSMLSNKSWVYFPDSDSPFYRVTVFSSYSADHVPNASAFWSLMCEAAEPKNSSNKQFWTKDILVAATIDALVLYGFITSDLVVSKYYRRLDHGYPVPSLKRDTILKTVQPWLESKGIYSRGRFGGWRYEVSNQDHSFMQGVEIVDWLLKGIAEETYPDPNLVNSKRNSGRRFPTDLPLEYEFVIAHYNEPLEWLRSIANHCHVYHKGNDLQPPPFPLYSWEKLPNVGRESHTYLYHIINNYDNLADITVFLQGDGIEMSNRNCFKNPMEYVHSAKRNVFCRKPPLPVTYWGKILFKSNYQKRVESGELRLSNLTLGDFYERLFGGSHPKTYFQCLRGCFSATKEKLRRHPVEFYKRGISFVSDHPDPTEGHYFERLWHTIVS